MSRHPTSPRSRRLARAVEGGSRRRIEREAPEVFRSKAVSREPWDTSSEWLDSIRGAIRVAEEALSSR
jgi:hypothetical protein